MEGMSVEFLAKSLAKFDTRVISFFKRRRQDLSWKALTAISSQQAYGVCFRVRNLIQSRTKSLRPLLNPYNPKT